MIKRMLLLKAVALFSRQDVNLTLITPDKITGNVSKDVVKDIIPHAVKFGYVIIFRTSSNPNRFDFEINQDLPF